MTPLLTPEAFAALGAPELVYLRPVKGAEILANILTHYRFPDRTFVGSPGRIQALKNALAAVGRKE